tara:strand:+ start:26 stop:190 length:165 start_codon:yes stop_codon:yes gene_type:complete
LPIIKKRTLCGREMLSLPPRRRSFMGKPGSVFLLEDLYVSFEVGEKFDELEEIE